jgi:hypothetical protein
MPHVVMLGDPQAPVSEAFGEPSQLDRGGQRRRRRRPITYRRELEH